MLTNKFDGAAPKAPLLNPEAPLASEQAAARRRNATGLFLYLAALGAVFWRPLVDLFDFSRSTNLFSHILLVPFIFAYLVWVGRHRLAGMASRAPVAAGVAASLGMAALAFAWHLQRSGVELVRSDALALSTLAFVMFALAGLFFFFGRLASGQFAFAVIFLLFMVPLPQFAIDAVEAFLQHTSALVAYGFIQLSGMPVFRQGLVLQVPGMAVEVAPECSGIRSSLVLFMTSILAAHLLLRTGWKRALFISSVIPIGIVRNALRIFTLVMVCVYIDPGMMSGPLHKRGGTPFFALSLIPLFFILYLLRRSEREESDGAKLNPAGRSSSP